MSGSDDDTLDVGSTRHSSHSTVAIPPEVREALPSQHIGKFVRTVKLGQGGMGEVWKAWDSALNRWVALKFLRGDDDAELERFRGEAQTAGKLSHPAIAAIYEVGEVDIRPFIAMQYIDGSTLKPGPRNVEMIRDAARAVAFAHEQGVIHRDLKPENLMVAGGQIFVMDFGLARHVEGASKISLSGSIVGTPSFMPPEQARGGRIDVRADVYGLGATLYALLAGRAPFRGANVYETLKLVQEAEPKPPAGDPDLVTIVMKCLEKDPARRYATATDLADELDRYLRHEPITARPASFTYRLRKAVERRKGLAIIAAAALLIIAGVTAGTWWTTAQSRWAREKLVTEMRSTSEACLAAALDLRRAGNIEGMKQQAAKVEEVCRRVPSAEAHYRIGRIRRALMDDAGALTEQERALGFDPRFGPARYERVVLTTREYRAQVRRLVDRARLAKEQPSPRALAAADPAAIAMTRRIQEDLAAIDGVSESELLCARGLRAWSEGDDGARALLEAAIVRTDLEEAFEALATIEFERGRFEEAARWWTEGARRDAGYLPFKLGHARAMADWGIALLDEGRDPGPAFTEAAAEYATMEDVDARRRLGTVHLNWANWLHTTGGDPVPHHEAAMLAYDLALRSDPRNVETLHSRGLVRSNRGAYEADRGGNPVAWYAAAEEDYRAALALDADIEEIWMNLGLVRMNLARHREVRGEETDAVSASALDAFGEALKRNPRREQSWSLRGRARSNWGLAQARLGRDVTDLFQKAIADFEESLKINPVRFDALVGRGVARRTLAIHQSGRGEESGALFDSALSDFAEAARAAPLRDESWSESGYAEYYRAQHVAIRGGDPLPRYRASIAAYDEAIQRNRLRDETWWGRGLAKSALATRLSVTGGDPGGHFADAVSDLDRAIELNPRRDEPWWRRGEARLNWAIYLRADKRTEALYAASVADLDQAITLNDRRVESWRNRANAKLNWALIRSMRSAETEALWAESIADVDRALALDRTDASVWFTRGAAFLSRAQHRSIVKKPAAEDYRQALAAFEEIRKIDTSRAAGLGPFIQQARDYLKEHPDE